MLSFRQVEAFRQTVAAGSVSAAAKILNTTQPNVSRLLRELEVVVRFRLFDRHRRGVSPTPEANRLYEEVERAFVGLKDIERAADEIRQNAAGQISVATIPAGAFELLPGSIADFGAELLGGASVGVQVWTTAQIVDSVRSGRIDIGIASPSRETPEHFTFARRRLAYVVLMREDHPLARKTRPLRAEDLAPHELVLPDQDYLLGRCEDAALSDYLRRPTRLTSHVSYAAATMVMSGLGPALVDPLTARFFSRQADLVARPLLSAPRYDLAILRAPTRMHARPVEQFAGALLERLDSLTAPPSQNPVAKRRKV